MSTVCAPPARRTVSPAATGSGPIGDPPAFERDYDGVATSLRVARADVATWLRDRQCDDDTIERAVLVVSELASNALQAAPGRPFNLKLIDATLVAAHPGLFELTVSNPCIDTAPPPREQWVAATPSAQRGRGLAIVAALSSEVRVDVGAESVRVTAQIQAVAAP